VKYAFLVAWREYSENARTKGFWIGIFLMPTILFLSIQAPIWLNEKATPTRYFVLVDQSGSLAPVVEAALEKRYLGRVREALHEYARKYSTVPVHADSGASGEGDEGDGFTAPDKTGKDPTEALLAQVKEHIKPGAPPFKEPRRLFQRAELPAGIDPKAPVNSLAEQLKPYLRGDKRLANDAQLDAALLVPADVETGIVRPNAPRAGHGSESPSSIQYWSVNASDFSLRDEVERAVNGEVRRREYLAKGLDGAAVRQIEQTYAPIASFNPKKEKGKEAIDSMDTIKQWAPSGFVYLLWLAIFVIVQMLLNNTIEEKSNRIIEVLLSSVTPGELMMGKLVGIAAVGLTMVGAWMVALFGVLSWKAGGASDLAGQLLTLVRGSSLVPLFCVYFLLGYLMYAGFILSIGSVCNTLKEAQNYMSVLTMLMMVPLLTMTFIPKDPNGTLARVLSWIPIYTPFTMMNRANADPPLVDLVGTLVLLLATTALALWMSGKVFRIGILRTGQPPKVVEMVRWALRRDR
jgi:ABC-2 type transport system permease protein